VKKGEYYQSLHAIRLLSEAFTHLHWVAFEKWAEEHGMTIWANSISRVAAEVIDNDTSPVEQIHHIVDVERELQDLQSSLDQFNLSLQSKPTAVFWLTFMEMADILVRFIYYQREGNWIGYLSESANMVPYLTAVGHHKYGQQSLPLFIHEMKQLPTAAPEVHTAMVNGAFACRRADGFHNAVSPDMLLEQTYNADAKETSGLGGITTNKAACTKWVYTKHLTAAVSSQLTIMLNGDENVTEGAHHEDGEACIIRDIELVRNMTQYVDENPFLYEGDHLINIVSGEHAQPGVEADLTHVEEIGRKAVSYTITNDKKVVKLKTFHTPHKKALTSKNKAVKQSNEMAALFRMTQLIACGEDVDVQSTVGHYECSSTPPALFNEDSSMRLKGTKSSLVKVLLKETDVKAVENLPESELSTDVLVDAMYAIRKWSFVKGELFGTIAKRYKQKLFNDVPAGTKSIHLCCDRYRDVSLKSVIRQQRVGQKQRVKLYDVTKHYTTPDAADFFAADANKASLLRFICEELSEGPLEDMGVQLYLGGGFTDETKTLLVNDRLVTSVPELESTHEEADTRLILHMIHAARNGSERVVLHVNDTDVIVLCIYYASTDYLDNLQELWIRTDYNRYLPIHTIAAALGPGLCHRLPFIHSLSGRDITSYPFFTGKKSWFEAIKVLDTPAIELFGETDNDMTPEVLNEATKLCIQVYSKKDDDFDDLPTLRAHNFLKHKSASLLNLLPPTEMYLHSM